MSDSDDFFTKAYDELRRIAKSLLRNERVDHTNSPTDLVHVAYMRLSPPKSGFENTTQFKSAFVNNLRRALVDHARAKKAQKRGGAAKRKSLDQYAVSGVDDNDLEWILVIDEMIERLKERCPIQAEIFELRLFGGLSTEKVAEHMDGMTFSVVRRKWEHAQVFLKSTFGDDLNLSVSESSD